MEVELDSEEFEKIVDKVVNKLLVDTNLKYEISIYLNDMARNKVVAWMDHIVHGEGNAQIIAFVRRIFETEFNELDHLKLQFRNPNIKQSQDELYKAYVELSKNVSELEKNNIELMIRFNSLEEEICRMKSNKPNPYS